MWDGTEANTGKAVGRSGKAGTLQDFLMGGKGWGEFSTLYLPGREQEAAVLLLLFCSCQRALTPVWVTGFIFLRKIELICFLDFNLSLFFGFVQFLWVLLQRAHHYF